MGGSIRLSEKHGVNPALVKCRYCGEAVNEVALLGDAREYECGNCNGHIIGKRPNPKDGCPHCGYKGGDFKSLGEYDGSRGIMGVCDTCQKKLADDEKEIREVVEAGGVYWRCSDCNATGAIRKSDYADAVRKAHGIEPPALCGVKFSSKDCPVCGPNKVQP